MNIIVIKNSVPGHFLPYFIYLCEYLFLEIPTLSIIVYFASHGYNANV